MALFLMDPLQTLSFDIVPLDPLTPKLTTRLSAGAQIPMTQQLAHIDYIINNRIQAATWNKTYFWQSHTFKYLNKFITLLQSKEVDFEIL